MFFKNKFEVCYIKLHLKKIKSLKKLLFYKLFKDLYIQV